MTADVARWMPPLPAGPDAEAVARRMRAEVYSRCAWATERAADLLDPPAAGEEGYRADGGGVADV